MRTAFGVYEYAVLAYFATLNLLYALFGFLGLRMVVVYARELSRVALKDLLEREVHYPVSILVPAFNEERSIVASVRSFVSLHYPLFEVIVVSDGSEDRTIDALIEAFGLMEEPRIFRHALPTRPVRRVLRSLRHPHLTVVDKEWGGKSDALNAALNLARYPLVSAVDSDSLLDAEAILRASRLFAEDEAVVAVGGTIRPLNGAVMAGGRVTELRMPERWIERVQILEYARAFFLGRAGWSWMGALLVISGAFGLFRRDVVMDVGGYSTGTLGEDMELVMRIRKHARRTGMRHRVVFTPDPICWTEIPSDLGTLRRQRNRWHRGLWTNLWMHRDMLGNPRYGRLGMLALPYFWLFEGLGPFVEVSGYVLLPVTAALGLLFPSFAVLFLALAVLYGVLLSQIAAGVEALLLRRYPRFSDRVTLFAAAFVEFLGIRQILTLERFRATFQAFRHPGGWGEMRRRGIPTTGRQAP